MCSVLQGRLATPTKPCVEAFTTQRRAYQGSAKKVKRFVPARCYLKESPLMDHDKDIPARMKNLFKDIPAYEKWVTRTSQPPENFSENKLYKKKQTARARLEMENHKKVKLNGIYLGQFGDALVTLECSRRDILNRVAFERRQGKFADILEYMTEKEKWNAEPKLYLAQQPLDELPKELQDDLPPPEVIKILGQGDIYASSLWMGKAPTHTPLHRDPNPNLFVQLAGKKVIRMIKPDAGRAFYEKVREGMYKKTSDGATMRGEEMMQGEEFDKMNKAVWDDKHGAGESRLGIEVELKPGHGLYIPLGWWHAVRGTGTGPNISVNWWFR